MVAPRYIHPGSDLTVLVSILRSPSGGFTTSGGGRLLPVTVEVSLVRGENTVQLQRSDVLPETTEAVKIKVGSSKILSIVKSFNVM